MRKITLIGAGAGPATITAEAKTALAEARLVIGPKRLLRDLPVCPEALCAEAALAEKITAVLEANPDADACILLSGDSGFYSGAHALLPLLSGYEVSILPGISSLQLFAARLQQPWQNWRLCSAHGKTCDAVYEVCHGAPAFFLTGGEHSPATLCRALTEAGLGFLPVAAGEELGTAQEKVTQGTAEEFAERSFSSLSVLLAAAAPRPAVPSGALPDERFRRLPDVPMTKQDVRAAVLAHLAVTEGETCWDIGAGTGSVGIELALRAGSVWGVECRPEALALAEENRKMLGAWNYRLIEGTAPEALKALPAPDAVFVGGSGGKLSDIVNTAYTANPEARLCVAAVTLETLSGACEALAALGREADVIQLSVARSRAAGRSHLMLAQNPVYLIMGGRKA